VILVPSPPGRSAFPGRRERGAGPPTLAEALAAVGALRRLADRVKDAVVSVLRPKATGRVPRRSTAALVLPIGLPAVAQQRGEVIKAARRPSRAGQFPPARVRSALLAQAPLGRGDLRKGVVARAPSANFNRLVLEFLVDGEELLDLLQQQLG